MLKISSQVKVREDCSLAFGNQIGIVTDIKDGLLPIEVMFSSSKQRYLFDSSELICLDSED